MVSACLMGVNCRYDGRHSACRELLDLAGSLFLVPFCPEQLGGLPTPRPAANITGGDGSDIAAGRGRIVNLEGLDVTGAFLRGAQESVRLAELYGVRVCIMKDKKPFLWFQNPLLRNCFRIWNRGHRVGFPFPAYQDGRGWKKGPLSRRAYPEGA